MRSSWIKWARAVKHQRVLARATREFRVVQAHEYVRTDNGGDWSDPLVRVHWRLRVKVPYPERWSLLLGDALTNLRAALDHAFWDAVIAHSGPPTRPNRVAFPITATAKSFRGVGDLKALVAPQVWEVVEAMQPFHGGDEAHTAPLEVLRWLSNVDKHRNVHVVGRTVFNTGPTLIKASTPTEVVDESRHEGATEDGTVVARLKFKRPEAGEPIDLAPTFAHIASIQVSEGPREYRSLAGAMQVTREDVLKVLSLFTDRLGADFPDHDGLELGEEHEAYAPEAGGLYR
jgi:hypothetical protein